LYLAALSLSGRQDPSAFIAAFAGDDRHIVDYLGGEVLDGLDQETRGFLVRTSILERVSAPLCDHLLGSRDAAGKLFEVERANLDLCLARAWVLMDRGRPHEAERWLLDAPAEPEGVVLHAVLCFKLGKLAHAESIAREAITRAPVESPLGLPVAYCILGIAL